MRITPVHTKKVYMEIVDQLTDMILRGAFAEGEQLPSERELAEQLQVGRGSLREALSVLKMMGLIETKHGQGRYVHVTNERASLLHFGSTRLGEEESPFALLEARRALEPGIAAMAAKARSEDDLLKLRGILESAETRLHDTEHRTAADRLLHKTVAEATHNHLIQAVQEFLCDFMGEALWDALDKTAEEIPGRPQQGWVEHRAICEAIKAQDAGGASEAAFDHLRSVEGAMLAEYRSE
jgi:GntR family transcriptional repressor for pyruvate dehydrogenase complex